MYITHSSLPKSFDRANNHSKSLHKFILLNKNRQIEQNYQWKPLRVKQVIIQRSNSLNKQISFGGSYSNKKSILLTLNQSRQNQSFNSHKSQKISPSKTSINTEIFLRSKLDLNHHQKKLSEPNEQKINETAIDYLQNVQKMESKLNKFTNTTAFFNKKVEKGIQNFKISNMSTKISQNSTTSKFETNLYERICKSYRKGRKVIGILTMKRYGLRIRLKHTFGEVCMCQNNLHQKQHELSHNKKMNELVKEMLGRKESEKPLYFFHLNKEPLVTSNQLSQSENIILASSSPILNIDNEFHFKVYEEAEKISKLIKSAQNSTALDRNSFNSGRKDSNRDFYKSPTKKHENQEKNDEQHQEQTTQYDWEVISNIDHYIEQIVQNPQKIRSSVNSLSQKTPSLKHQIKNLYNEKFNTSTKQQTGQNFRNPLLEDHSHYHSELKQKKLLSVISSKLEQKDFIKNNHILKGPTIEALIELDKREKEKQLQDLQNPNIIKRNIKNTLKSKKSIVRQLDQKNTLLFEQNVPYLIDKYGISRYEIHNLYTIYKTLQKISSMKFKDKDNAGKILKKGIDRSTFDEGMKRLDINPGDQVIKNICYFDDFISWEQFLKIVSIGLRKTPEEKLQAILLGIGGANDGCLTKNQISILIGNSLNKIFDSEQTELKEYFTEVAMRDLDSDGSGTVDVSEIKKKCLSVQKIDLENGQKMDLITFLLLNS